MPIPDETKLRCFDVVFAEMIGGTEAVTILTRYHDEGQSLRDIGSVNGLHATQVLRILRTARQKLKRCGLWPVQWNERGRKVMANGR